MRTYTTEEQRGILKEKNRKLSNCESKLKEYILE